MTEDSNNIHYSTDLVSAQANDIRNLMYFIRGQQVMLDNDLAMLYQVETKVFNQAVARNIERFPKNFRFQLSKEEYDSLRSQFVTSKGRGGRRYLPYVFTEQGIAMLSGILRSDIAVQVSIRIMNTFVEMRRFIANNALLFEKVSKIELQQLEFQKQTDEKFAKVFRYIDNHLESDQKIFFDGQIYDAFSFIITLIQKAQKEIKLIDGYVDINTLNILSKKNHGVNVLIYTYPGAGLSNHDIALFNAQYPMLNVMRTNVFHDRFMILDNSIVYHIGASLKDAGKKCFGISLIQDSLITSDLLNRLNVI
ncbi:MAG: ORF6N domain-containing protein [Anaerolineaceae bacterium]|nr:ORF6N domain-containing protein [Anaerolineaceae bacterium]